jgi:hypothetical protein
MDFKIKLYLVYESDFFDNYLCSLLQIARKAKVFRCNNLDNSNQFSIQDSENTS